MLLCQYDMRCAGAMCVVRERYVSSRPTKVAKTENKTPAKKAKPDKTENKTPKEPKPGKTENKTPKEAKPEIVTERDTVPRAVDVAETDFKVR